jgi:hypothetical protein
MLVSMSSPSRPEYLVVMNTSSRARPESRSAWPASFSLRYACAVSAVEIVVSVGGPWTRRKALEGGIGAQYWGGEERGK